MQTIRILALLEATSITGTAKAVLEFAYEARRQPTKRARAQIVVANFTRGEVQPQTALSSALQNAGIPFHFVRERGRFDTAVIAQLRSIIARERADVIWSNSVKSHFLVRAGKLAGPRPWVAYHHGYTTTDIKMRLYNQLDRWSLRRADRVLTVCQPFAQQIIGYGVDARRVHVQHMPIRPFTTETADCYRLRQTLELGPNEKVVLSVGRLSREKGHIDLLRAFAEIRERNAMRLIFVGDGPEKSTLEQACQRHRLEKTVLFVGHQNDVKPFYGIADIFALPSYTEGSPNVLLEAMAAGVPVVATKVGGIPELVDNDKSALLVRSGDTTGLAAAILRLLEDEAVGRRLTASAREVVEKHSPETYYESLLSVFEESLASSGLN
jgi:glycosyltransferase involved in cell wall biosynthesis